MSHSTRRSFLRRTAGVAAAALGAKAVSALDPVGETSPGGGLIDCQSHLFCEELVALMEKRQSDPVVVVKDGVRVVKMGDRSDNARKLFRL